MSSALVSAGDTRGSMRPGLRGGIRGASTSTGPRPADGPVRDGRLAMAAFPGRRLARPAAAAVRQLPGARERALQSGHVALEVPRPILRRAAVSRG